MALVYTGQVTYGFEQDDLIVNNKKVFNDQGNLQTTQEIWAKVVDKDDANGTIDIQVIKGVNYLDNDDYTNGMDFIRYGNESNSGRQGIVEINISGSDAPSIFVKDGICLLYTSPSPRDPH